MSDKCPQCALLLEALKEIAEGKGRYSQDQLTHASNTIEDQIQLANDALLVHEAQRHAHADTL